MEAWWRISCHLGSPVRFFGHIVCPSFIINLRITSIYAIITISKKNAKFYMKFYDSCCFRYFSRIGIFRTENSVRYRCGRGFCRFGMRSIGKIPLKHMDSQKNVASLGLTNHAIWIKIQKEVNKLNKIANI